MKIRAGAMLLLSSLFPFIASGVSAQTYQGPISAPCVVQTNLSCTPVSATNPLPTTGGGGSGGGAATIADGADTSEGATTAPAYTDTTGAAAGTVNGISKGQFVALTGLFKAGQSIGNTAFGISGTLPAYATTPTFNLGTAPNLNVVNLTGTNSIGTVGLNAGSNAIGSITNTSFGATQATASALNATVVGTGTFATQTTNGATSANQMTELSSLSSILANQTNNTQSVITRGRYNTTRPTITNAATGELQIDSLGGLASILCSYNGAACTIVGTPSGDGLGVQPGPYVVAQNMVTDPISGTLNRARGDTVGAFVVVNPDATAGAGITPSTVQNATGNILKASPGNVYSINAVNSTVAGFLVVYNAATVPTSGTTITAANGLYCMPVAASVGFRDTFTTPIYASTGAVLLMSTSCTTYTPVGTAPITLTGQVK